MDRGHINFRGDGSDDVHGRFAIDRRFPLGLVTASAISEDLIHKAGKRDLSPEKLLTVSRIATIIVGIFAFVMACTSTDLAFSLVSYAWSGLGASFGPVLLCIIYWKKVTKEAAIGGMLTGSVSTVIWKNIPGLNSIISEKFVSYLLAFAVIILVTLITTKPKKPVRFGKPDRFKKEKRVDV